jgi:arginine exporter protein ArgO
MRIPDAHDQRLRLRRCGRFGGRDADWSRGQLPRRAGRARAVSVAAAAALGVASVDGGYAVIAAHGGAGLQALLSEVSDWLEWAAAIVLAAVAIHTVQVAVGRYRSSGSRVGRLGVLTPARAYVSLVALTAFNPATVITFAAVVMGRPSTFGGSSWAAVTLFATGAFMASAVWQLLLTGSGNILGRLVSGPRGQLAIAICSALIMLGLAVGVLLS